MSKVIAKYGSAAEIIPAPAPEGSAPTEFRIFARGVNPDASNENFIYDDVSAQSVIGIWKGRNLKLHCDFEHGSELGPEDPAFAGVTVTGSPAAGWFDIEDRPDGLWAVNCDWKEPALTYLKAGTYKFFSPVFYVDSDGRIIELKSLALTNVPMLDALTPLAAKQVATTKETTMPTPETEKKLVEAKDGMSLEKHADCMDKHADRMDKVADKIGSALDKHIDVMTKMMDKVVPAKAKDDDDDDDDADDGDEKDDKKADKRACKVLINHHTKGVNALLTPGEARDLLEKVKAKSISKDGVEAFIQTKVEAKVKADTTAKETKMPVSFKYGPKMLVAAKNVGGDRQFKFSPKDSTPEALTEYTLAVCKYLQSRDNESKKTYAPERVAQIWAENIERSEAWKQDQFTVTIPGDAKAISLNGD